MAAHLNPLSGPVPVQGPYHHMYHAEAEILSGELEHPIRQPIAPYGRVVLEHTRRESLITQTVGETNIEGLISFERGHTRVAGTQVQHKTDIFGHDHSGWVTLATAVLEGYNVVDIITADRVVAQVSTEHALTDGEIPSVSFIGSRFENLRVGGYPVEVELDLGICGARPEGNRPYLHEESFLERIGDQIQSIFHAHDVPKGLQEKCGAQITYIDDLKRRAKERASGGLSFVSSDEGNGDLKLHFSLIKTIAPIPIPGVKVFGNHIFIPNFGAVALGEVEVGISNGHNAPTSWSDGSAAQSTSNYFRVNMLKMRLGCPVQGGNNGPSAMGNGGKGPGGS